MGGTHTSSCIGEISSLEAIWPITHNTLPGPLRNCEKLIPLVMNQRCFEVLAAYEIRGKKNTCQKLLKNFSKKMHRLGVLNYKSAKVSSEICSIENGGIYGSWNWNYKSKFGCNHTLNNDCRIAKEILFKSTCKSFSLVAHQSITEGGCQVQCERVWSITQQTSDL